MKEKKNIEITLIEEKALDYYIISFLVNDEYFEDRTFLYYNIEECFNKLKEEYNIINENEYEEYINEKMDLYYKEIEEE